MINDYDQRLSYIMQVLNADSASQIGDAVGMHRSTISGMIKKKKIPDKLIDKVNNTVEERFQIVSDAFSKSDILVDNVELNKANALKIGEIAQSLAVENTALAGVIGMVSITDAKLAAVYGVREGTIRENRARAIPGSAKYPIAKIGIAVIGFLTAKLLKDQICSTIE